MRSIIRMVTLNHGKKKSMELISSLKCTDICQTTQKLRYIYSEFQKNPLIYHILNRLKLEFCISNYYPLPRMLSPKYGRCYSNTLFLLVAFLFIYIYIHMYIYIFFYFFQIWLCPGTAYSQCVSNRICKCT